MKYHRINYLMGIIIMGAALSCESGSENKLVLQDGKNRVAIAAIETDLPLSTINLPQGFEITIWASDIPNARSLAQSEDGIVFVGNRRENNVYAVVDEDGDGKADYRYTLATDLNTPNGVAYKDGDLYVAEINRILRFSDIRNNLVNPTYEVIYDQYPTEGHHGWKFIAFGPDGYLYVPVGAPCNICESEDEIFASITRININGDHIQPEIFAHGVRNTVGFDWHPDTKELWFTDNNRDMMGDDLPDCTLNHASEQGLHFGYPYWHAGDVKDPEFGDKGKKMEAYEFPAARLGAHVAPLGMRFYTGNMFPEKYDKSIFIAEHGSWNRSKKVGYKIRTAHLNGTSEVGALENFAEGWLDESTQEVWGRPVDVLQLKDGSLLVSDDLAGVIYRISYSG
ncbi:PQQ-dependent sugar dehydrogenase [Negadavirga shengliensis]|uniref:PQQ-dependent sugar dehydrogenase n=1 Tax=Negadavirga shengliensis TaxID=1389218 RepID=A0ABV9T3I1_9BACT